MADIDLDALEQEAQDQAEGTHHAIAFRGTRYELTPTLPLKFGHLLTIGQISEALRLVFVDPAQVDEFLDSGISQEAFVKLSEKIGMLYGAGELGESSASSSSSASTAARSRRTSSRSTG